MFEVNLFILFKVVLNNILLASMSHIKCHAGVQICHEWSEYSIIHQAFAKAVKGN